MKLMHRAWTRYIYFKLEGLDASKKRVFRIYAITPAG